MKTPKQELLDALESMPDDSSMESLIERIRFREKLRISREQAERGEGVPHEQVMEDLRRWATSLGRPKRAKTSMQ